MGIDLEALANDLRAAGISCQKMWREHPEPNGWSLVIGNAGDALSWVYDDGWFTLSADDIEPPTLALIARHLGAGQIETEQEPTDAEMQDAARTVLCGIVEATRQSNERAGKPVAADRAALVERVKAAIEMFLGDWLDASYGPYDQLAKLSVSAVEAAGWGPRAEPVAAPEPPRGDLKAVQQCEQLAVAVLTALQDSGRLLPRGMTVRYGWQSGDSSPGAWSASRVAVEQP